MNPIIAQSLISGGSKLVSALIGGLGGGGKNPKLPQYLIDLARLEYEKDNFTGFMPDEQAFDDKMTAEVDAIMAQLPYGAEEFNANLASRGTFGAGEAPKYFYKDVVAPVARAATSAVATSKLGYAQSFQRGKMAAANMKSQALNRLIGLETAQTGLAREDFGYEQSGRSAFFGEIGGIVGDVAGSFGYASYLDSVFGDKKKKEVY